MNKYEIVNKIEKLAPVETAEKWDCVGFMVVLGKDERLKFEADKENYSQAVQEIYDNTHTYHDGKWVMFEPTDTSLFNDFIRLLSIKRKPNKK